MFKKINFLIVALVLSLVEATRVVGLISIGVILIFIGYDVFAKKLTIKESLFNEVGKGLKQNKKKVVIEGKKMKIGAA